jgi:hypothetical protein
MRMILLAGGAALLGGGAYIGGAFDAGTAERGAYYPLAPATAGARLAAMKLGSELGPAEAGRVRLVLRSRNESLLHWELMFDNKRLADVHASLSPDSEGTRVQIDAAYAYSFEPMETTQTSLLNEVVKIIIDEKVDSALEARTFDRIGVKAKIRALEAANPQATAAIEQAFEERSARAGMRSEGEQAWNGTPIKPTTSAKPLPPPDFSETHADGGWGKN